MRIPRSVATRLWEQALHAPAQCVGGWVGVTTPLVHAIYSSFPTPSSTQWHLECFHHAPERPEEHPNTTVCPWQTFTTACPPVPLALLKQHPWVLALDLQEPGVLSMRCFSLGAEGVVEPTLVLDDL